MQAADSTCNEYGAIDGRADDTVLRNNSVAGAPCYFIVDLCRKAKEKAIRTKTKAKAKEKTTAKQLKNINIVASGMPVDISLIKIKHLSQRYNNGTIESSGFVCPSCEKSYLLCYHTPTEHKLENDKRIGESRFPWFFASKFWSDAIPRQLFYIKRLMEFLKNCL